MKSKVLKAKSLIDLDSKLNESNKLNTIAIVFASININQKKLYKVIEEKGYIPITISSSGQFAEGKIVESGITCMLLEVPDNSFKIKVFEKEKNCFNLGKKVGKFVKEAFENSNALIFTSMSLSSDTEALLKGFKKSSINQVPLFGAVASGDLNMKKNFIGIDGKVSKNSIGIVVFDKSKISLEGITVNGWSNIGASKQITKSYKNRVYEIDNKPIKEVYKEYFNFDENTSLLRYLQFPISLCKKNDQMVTRVVVDVNSEYFTFSGNIKEGSKIYFCSPNITKAVSSAINEINEFQNRKELLSSDAVLSFSCSARLFSFSFYIQNELDALNRMWNKKHMGIFSGGEIGSMKHGSFQLHNNSLSVVFIKDKTSNSRDLKLKSIDFKENKIKIDKSVDKKKVIQKLQEEKQVLTNLLYKVSNELIDYKNNLEEKVEEQVGHIFELNKEIINTQKEVVFTMGSIGETRSKETGNHVRRVAQYSKIFAEELGFSKDEVNLLVQASPMHDIGKVGIPDSILNKPSKLTLDEFEEIKKHTTLGYSMLKSSNRDILKAAAIIAFQHHERWDGSGYPSGLKEEEIHIYGRITAIADVFDALGSNRVYKKAWSDEKIFNFFKEQRSKQFDPKLVDIFFKNLDSFKKVRKRYEDEL